MAKHDIVNREDIVLMIDTFYEKVREDKTIGHIFNDVAKVDWPSHMPKMYSFWSSLLIGEQSYTGNPMIKHIELSKITAMTQPQFSEWMYLFTETIDQLFEGEKASEAKSRARNIASLMLHKIQAN